MSFWFCGKCRIFETHDHEKPPQLEAVILLEKHLEEDPFDVNTLWVLARVYFSGTHAQGEDPWDTSKLAHRDLDKSLAMLERIRAIQSGPDVEEAIEVVHYALNRGQ